VRTSTLWGLGEINQPFVRNAGAHIYQENGGVFVPPATGASRMNVRDLTKRQFMMSSSACAAGQLNVTLCEENGYNSDVRN